MGKVAYVHLEADGTFTFYNADGSENRIAGDPVLVDESHCAYLDTVPWIKRTGDTEDEASEPADNDIEDEPADPDGGGEE